jgi:hypothetical protein
MNIFKKLGILTLCSEMTNPHNFASQLVSLQATHNVQSLNNFPLKFDA